LDISPLVNFNNNILAIQSDAIILLLLLLPPLLLHKGPKQRPPLLLLLRTRNRSGTCREVPGTVRLCTPAPNRRLAAAAGLLLQQP
jgi:hypothetical protein